MLSALDSVHVAIDSLSEQIAANPTPELYLRRCKAYATLKDMPAAFADCRQAIKLDKEHAGAHNYLAGLLIQVGKYAEAEKEATKALKLDPQIEDLFMLVAHEGLRLTKKIDAAPTAALHNKRGVLSMQQGALEPARDDFEQAISLDPTLDLAYTNLIDVLLKMGLPLDAEKALDTISDADPRYQNAKTLMIKQWCHLERKAKLAPHEATYHALSQVAVIHESVPTLQKAQEYDELSQQAATPDQPLGARAAKPAARAAAKAAPAARAAARTGHKIDY